MPTLTYIGLGLFITVIMFVVRWIANPIPSKCDDSIFEKEFEKKARE